MLVHEATFAKEDRKLAYDYYHSTTEQAAVTAKEARAKQAHFNPYQRKISGRCFFGLQKEAVDVFPNSVAAYDFLEVNVPRG